MENKMIKDLQETSHVDIRLAVGELVLRGFNCRKLDQFLYVNHPDDEWNKESTEIYCYKDGSSYKVKSEIILDLIGN